MGKSSNDHKPTGIRQVMSLGGDASDASSSMRILTFSTLFPNAAAPSHGIFVENRMADYRARFGGDMYVVAPVPWFPFSNEAFGHYSRYARAPLSEERRGVRISHPRYFLPPKVGMTYAAHSLETCFLKEARRLLDSSFEFDLIDAHYLYPDGVAAARVARKLNKPLILTARGSDVSQIAQFPRQRAMILEAVYQADAVICVAKALKDALIDLGAPAEKLVVLRNGVDLSVFRPLDRDALRKGYELSGHVIASVGHLIERKGHDLVITALKDLPETTLVIAGSGEEEKSLKALADGLGVRERVRFLGQLSHDKLPEIYNLADALVLASSREGWPNVLLEAMACGTPAIAAPIWGCGEVITEAASGRLAAERSAAAFVDAINELKISPPERQDTRAYAEKFSWEETSAGLNEVFASAIARAEAIQQVKHRPIRPAEDTVRPRLLVTVDTEEEFDWTEFTDVNHTNSSLEGVAKFQELCGSKGVTPLYFLTYPLITEGTTAAFFRDLADKRRADLGLHLHDWVTPPFVGYEGEYYSWQSNLPLDVLEAKMASLAAAFEDAFGQRAVAHRAGRYGVGPSIYNALAKLGIKHDFSPSPAFNFSGNGGPDFRQSPNQPSIIELNGKDSIVVTPVVGANAVQWTSFFLSQDSQFIQRRLTTSPLANFISPLRLTSEQARITELKALTRRLIKDKVPVLTFSLHSTSLTPGGNPYSETEQMVQDQFGLIETYLDFFKNDLGGEFIGLAELDEAYGINPADISA